MSEKTQEEEGWQEMMTWLWISIRLRGNTTTSG